MKPCIGYLVLIASIMLAGPAGAAPVEVDLELVLAVDVSRSIDEEEAALQRDGYVAAFRHPSVIDAIRHGPLGRIAVAYLEWGEYGSTSVVADWTMISDGPSAEALADRLRRSARLVSSRTSISGALDVAAVMLDGNEFSGRRRVIDVSGDGANNSGDLVNLARDRTVARGITINGLPILNQRESPGGFQQIESLDLYYRDCVIGGPGAFYVVAKDFNDFARAILRKLILEIAGAAPPADLRRRHRQAHRQGGPLRNPYAILAAGNRAPPPCYIGEQRWRQRRGYGPGGWMPQFPRQ